MHMMFFKEMVNCQNQLKKLGIESIVPKAENRHVQQSCRRIGAISAVVGKGSAVKHGVRAGTIILTFLQRNNESCNNVKILIILQKL